MSDVLKYAVIGWPVAHSRSPLMQNAGFRALDIAAEYCAIEVRPEELPQAVARLRAEGFAGWNVTVPHKEAIIPLLDEIAGEEARAARSVNTVMNSGGRLLGFSTDGYGVEMALRHEFGFTAIPRRQVYLGTGGAARAASVYAARHGAEHITLANRTAANAERLAEIIAAAAPACRVEILPLSAGHRMEAALAGADILFQCTSLGLHEGDPEPLPAEMIPQSLPVYDFVYTPSVFRKKLMAQGNRAAGGMEMLLMQGCRSLEIWTGRTAPVDAMRRALCQ